MPMPMLIDHFLQGCDVLLQHFTAPENVGFVVEAGRMMIPPPDVPLSAEEIAQLYAWGWRQVGTQWTAASLAHEAKGA